ncbi:hypothetical protein AMATHDRAFT_65802 [Amanita thiersii Skay4041]|uniref:Uncharacterized protein n=1 Tax=Amanita thiersii Skay4041 TaxID=703135 RepID=A0A2A9NBB6_9AGAR|nr:hypothetical protein AMATHDRAFT_65802 [Amanita thiersii Skay4041]
MTWRLETTPKTDGVSGGFSSIARSVAIMRNQVKQAPGLNYAGQNEYQITALNKQHLSDTRQERANCDHE